MYCAWCGSKGFSFNPLIIFPCSPYGDALYECNWCLIKIDQELEEAS